MGLRGVREAVDDAGQTVSVALVVVGLVALFAVALGCIAIVEARRA